MSNHDYDHLRIQCMEIVIMLGFTKDTKRSREAHSLIGYETLSTCTLGAAFKLYGELSPQGQY